MQSFGLTSLMRLIYPPACVACDAVVAQDNALCGACWAQMPFVNGMVCEGCGVPLVGEARAGDLCDACLQTPRNWGRGRAALVYRDLGRQMVLRLKHGDRMDLAVPAGVWLTRAAKPLIRPDTLVAPVPLHWVRFAQRGYNQSALLAQQVARLEAAQFCPDLLQRPRATAVMHGMSAQDRFTNVSGAFIAHPKRKALLKGRSVLLVDDVLTSGATLEAATQVCLEGGAARVDIVVLARVAKDA
ncbi:DNA utilization protein GntX [Aquimixticola soesokkakensis]|uniref:DNA utilization protein GntX n=1 Tax=Aquimixticola soesokkakensis TaxID=1519096 RepID=A0A1Y5R7Q8_9RHOB|nr:ComF family protein [Aquimixticola soesokkakensis]SLN11041.1 DNA utilization protein GntX [Aquimixticola soesokkakensis]